MLLYKQSQLSLKKIDNDCVSLPIFSPHVQQLWEAVKLDTVSALNLEKWHT